MYWIPTTGGWRSTRSPRFQCGEGWFESIVWPGRETEDQRSPLTQSLDPVDFERADAMDVGTTSAGGNLLASCDLHDGLNRVHNDLRLVDRDHVTGLLSPDHTSSF